jgi:hypothetical protein
MLEVGLSPEVFKEVRVLREQIFRRHLLSGFSSAWVVGSRVSVVL